VGWLPLTVLLAQGGGKVNASRRIIAEAIAQRKIESTGQAEFEAWAERFAGERVPALVSLAGAPLSIVSAYWRTDNARVDVTEILQDKVKDGKLEMKATNEAFGNDPEYGKTKRLEVEFVSHGIVGSATFAEESTVDLPPPRPASVAPVS